MDTAHQRLIQRQRDALRQRDGQPHAGERARAAADRDRIELRLGDAGLGQQRFRPRQGAVRHAARRDLEALDDLAIQVQGDGTGFGGGFEGEEFHGAEE